MSSIYSVVNATKRAILADEVRLAETLCTRMKGLLGQRELAPGKGLWIRPSQGVHTIGMAFPIDVVYLDRNSRIIRLYHRLAPFRLAALVLRARSILELPAGTLSRTRTEAGDLLEFKPVV